jgi:hypothetical protein
MKKTKHYQVGGELDSMESANFDPEALDIQKTTNLEAGDRILREMRDKEIDTKKKMPSKPVMPKATYSNEGRSRSTAVNKPDFSNEGRSVSPVKQEKLGDTALRMSKQADANRAAMESSKPAPTPRKRNILEEARESVRRGNVARSSMASGGKVSASNRADGIAQRGKTRGKMC